MILRLHIALVVVALAAHSGNSPVYAQSPQPLPTNGRVWRDGGGVPAAPLTIETSGSATYLVRLYEKSSNRPALTILVHGGKSVQTKAPYGEYTLRYAVGGLEWFGLSGLFGPSTEVYEANATLRFYRSGNKIHGQRVTLYGVVDGNMPTTKVNKSNF